MMERIFWAIISGVSSNLFNRHRVGCVKGSKFWWGWPADHGKFTGIILRGTWKPKDMWDQKYETERSQLHMMRLKQNMMGFHVHVVAAIMLTEWFIVISLGRRASSVWSWEMRNNIQHSTPWLAQPHLSVLTLSLPKCHPASVDPTHSGANRQKDEKKADNPSPNSKWTPNTSSTTQGGGGSFKNRKPIGEIGCCESGMAERIHWWTERCLRSPLFLSLSLTIYLLTCLSSMIFYVSIYLSIYLSRANRKRAGKFRKHGEPHHLWGARWETGKEARRRTRRGM